MNNKTVLNRSLKMFPSQCQMVAHKKPKTAVKILIFFSNVLKILFEDLYDCLLNITLLRRDCLTFIITKQSRFNNMKIKIRKCKENG